MGVHSRTANIKLKSMFSDKLKTLKTLLTKKTAYTVVSSVVLFLIISYLLNIDVDDLLTRGKAFVNPYAREEEEVVPKSWLALYGIEVTKDLDYSLDLDDDGLSLEEEYKYSTDPLNPDTDNDNYLDGVEVKNGYNPQGNGKLDLDGDGLPDYWEMQVGLSTETNDFALDPDKDGLPNYKEYEHMTSPLNPDTDRDGFEDLQEIKNAYDPSEAGTARPEVELVIEKLHIEVPIVLSESEIETDMLEDLKNGVSRYPDTAAPGQAGNLLVSGHSSNFAWVQGKYNYVFKNLNNLENGDKITVKTTQANGKSFEYTYIVYGKEVLKPDNPVIFEEPEKPIVTLVTCWPLGTNWNRLVVKGKMEKEKESNASDKLVLQD